MSVIDMYYDGYCPESYIKGERVEMRLNVDDFWESEGTGLQMAVYPPYAAIVPWRGNGQFRSASEVASNLFTGLILTETQAVKGNEHLPDESQLICNIGDLQECLDYIHESYEVFKKSRFYYDDPIFDCQRRYLNTLPSGVLASLIRAFEDYKVEFNSGGEFHGDAFRAFHKMLYDLKVIFDFKWMDWQEGWRNMEDLNFDFCNCTMLELSMYLTAIFRADRFNEGAIEYSLRNGMLDKVFAAIHKKNKRLIVAVFRK